MRRFATLALVVGLLGGLTAAPALAGPTSEFTETVTFDNPNPCDEPNTHEVTLVFNVGVYEHRNNTVWVTDSTITTDDGFAGTGHETSVFNRNTVARTFNFMATQPETGEKLMVKGHMTIVDDEVRVDRFTLRCVIDR